MAIDRNHRKDSYRWELEPVLQCIRIDRNVLIVSSVLCSCMHVCDQACVCARVRVFVLCLICKFVYACIESFMCVCVHACLCVSPYMRVCVGACVCAVLIEVGWTLPLVQASWCLLCVWRLQGSFESVPWRLAGNNGQKGWPTFHKNSVVCFHKDELRWVDTVVRCVDEMR